MYKPAEQMTTPVKLQKAINTNVSGAVKRTYEDAVTDPVMYCSFKSKGGTQSVQNDSLVVIDTAQVQMWYREDIEISDRLILLQNGSAWKILNIENVEMRNQLLMITVQRVGGA